MSASTETGSRQVITQARSKIFFAPSGPTLIFYRIARLALVGAKKAPVQSQVARKHGTLRGLQD